MCLHSGEGRFRAKGCSSIQVPGLQLGPRMKEFPLISFQLPFHSIDWNQHHQLSQSCTKNSHRVRYHSGWFPLTPRGQGTGETVTCFPMGPLNVCPTRSSNAQQKWVPGPKVSKKKKKTRRRKRRGSRGEEEERRESSTFCFQAQSKCSRRASRAILSALAMETAHTTGQHLPLPSAKPAGTRA